MEVIKMLYLGIFFSGIIAGMVIMSLCFSSSIESRKEEIREEITRNM